MFLALEVLEFIILLKNEVPNINIWCYSGFTFEQILEETNKSKLLKECDVLIDGKFEIEKRDITLKFRGSSNQRCIDVQESLKLNEVVLYLN